MARRKWIVIAAVFVSAIGAALVIVGPRTGWFEPRSRYQSVPTCAQVFTSPKVEDAVRTAFSTTWDQHTNQYAEFPQAPLCMISSLVSSSPAVADTPWSRSLRVSLGLSREEWDSARSPLFLRGGVREARRYFRENTNSECETSDGAAWVDESGLGDEAASCWTQQRYGGAYRHLLFRASNLNFTIELNGSNYDLAGESTEDGPALRDDLEKNARCIAEAIALYFDVQVTEKHTCGQSSEAA